MAPMAPASKVSASRVCNVEMAAKKKAPAKKAVKKQGAGTKGKGGIFPWVTNQPGTYTELPMITSFDFLGSDGDKLTAGAGIFGLSKFLYPKNTRK